MSDYRRAHIPGGCYFFTVVTHRRAPFFESPIHIERLREAFRRVRAQHRFAIEAIVVLPDHLHTVWRLPPDDADFSMRWRLIKHFVATGIRAECNARGEKAVWQRRFWEHVIRDEVDWRRHVDYVHYNPVRHGYVDHPADWPWSSFRHAVARGWYPPDWGRAVPDQIKGMDLE
jgi:putative transposase